MAAVPFVLLVWVCSYGFLPRHVWAQDPCYRYNVLSDQSRSVFTVSTSTYYRDSLVSGWHRFMGKAGDSMLEYAPSTGGNYRCTATSPGYLSGQHPKGSEGIVSRTVCFVYGGSTCTWPTTIQVKNCGNYFVYNLKALTNSRYHLRYCGSGEVADTSSNPCYGYTQLSDASRSARSTSGNYINDNGFSQGWYRFTGAAGDRMAEREVKWSSYAYRCGSLAHGWLNGNLPSTYQGKVYRTVCFTYGGNSCRWRARIKVKNCGNFFVYLLHGFSHLLYGGYLRYCGVGETVDSLTNPCNGYSQLSDASRSARSTPTSFTHDGGVHGWYRFTGAAGDRMAEHQVRWDSGIYRCGSRAHGWLNGNLPNPSEGKVFREVCFAYGGSSCWRRARIKVKNCGSFFVYLLHGFSYYRYDDYLRYCGVGETVDSLANPCSGYKQLSDASRSARNTSGIMTNDHSINGWYRFTGDAGDRLAEYELRWNNGVYRCGSQAHGWLNGNLPNPSEGKVVREVCFAYGGSSCWRRTNIKVKNCGNFFVYLLQGFSYYRNDDYLKYCGVGETVDSLANPCSGYKQLSDASRSARNTSGIMTNDHSINGWYRFTGDAGDRLAEYELRWNNGVYRCGSQAHGWLNGNLPNPSEGKVVREVCFAYGGSSCWRRTNIKVKNCGNFFVYLLQGFSYYRNDDYLKYCGVGKTVDSLANPCKGYKQLSEPSRSARNTPASFTNDNGLDGWYRFTGDAGDEMAEFEVRWDSGIYRCGSRAHGSLDGNFQSPSEGKVYRTVCFTYNGNSCWRRTRIKVKNCGNFFVYLLHGLSYYRYGDYMRYCGVGETVDSLANPCKGYKQLSEASRSARKTPTSFTNDNSLDGWYRFTGVVGDRMAEYQVRWDNGIYRCGSRAHGWLNGNLPTPSDGKVFRRACFAKNRRSCWRRTKVKVKNCGNFFVYLLHGFSHYRYGDHLRYCGVGKTVDSLANPCKGYKTVSDESRSILINNQSFTNDHSLTGWYRFSGKAGNSIVDYDPQWKPGLYRCKSAAHGWLTGPHPRGSEGKVNRVMCFSYNGSLCWHSTKIKIRNCGDFYVYLLNGMYYYQNSHYLRYCGAGETANNFPCKHYQLLTDETRVASYLSPTNRFCDRNMNGWYRFWGAAGHRMLDKCPVIGDKKVFPCGSYYHGWLNTTNPVPLDGTVNRTICISDLVSCECRNGLSRKIQMRNCGSYFVYNLKGLNDICSGNLANNARYCGMRDKDAYTVACSPNYMRIDLDRRYYNSSRYKSIRLLNSRCGHELSYDYITLGCIPGACGSIKKESKTEIIYINAVKLVTKFGSGLISRENDETIYFQCSYKRDAVLNNGASFDPVGEIAVSLKQFGNFSFHFNTYKTNAFDNVIKGFPVKLKLRDWLYFEVNATVQDSSLAMVIERCYSTPTMNPEEPGQFDLIKDKCVADTATSFVPASGLKRRFSMQVFRYENTTTVYIHCLVFLCRKNSTNLRCRTGCTGNNIYSRKRRGIAPLTDRGSDDHTSFFKLDSGQILLEASAPPKRNEKGDSAIPTSTLIFGGMAAIVLILIIIVVALVLKRRRPPVSANKHGKEIGLENVGRETNDDPSGVKT